MPSSPQSEGPSNEELSQAKARFGVCLFALAYVAGWSILAGTLTPLIIWVLCGYGALSAGWILLVKLRPGHVPWRRILVIFGDLGINTFFMHVLQAKGAFFYPMYLWIIVGNGMRFGQRYLLLATVAGVGYFAPMLFLSPYWKTNAVAGSGLLAGLVVLPLFYLSLIRNLHSANARLTEEVERSQAAARAKTEFLANMSHELRTPMGGVIGVADLMGETSLTPRQEQYLELIRRSASALLHIIDDILDFSRIEADKITLNVVPMDLRAVAADVCDLLRPSASEKDLDFRLDFPSDAPSVFLGDPTRVRQILFNLLGNAVKFTERGRVRVEYSWEERRDGPWTVSFQVTDTGVGIPREKLDHIFDKFERVESRLARRFGGSGLGLAISRLLARKMGGDIEVSSELGKGSVFTVALELEPSSEAAAESPKGAEEGWRTYGLKALVVEDNPVNLLVIDGFLERFGITSVSAGDGERALARWRAEPFDLIFMDVQLPVLNGLEATRRIRAEEDGGHHVPIVALTASATTEDRTACLEAGMDLHLHKPFRRADLDAALAALADRGLIRAA